jgi:hypothetical protein
MPLTARVGVISRTSLLYARRHHPERGIVRHAASKVGRTSTHPQRNEQQAGAW